MNKKGDIGIIILFVIVAIGVFIAWLFHDPAVCDERGINVDITPIYSLSTESETEGAFIIGIGGFDSETYYYVYQEDRGGVILEKLRASKTRLLEDDSMPRIERYKADEKPFCDKIMVNRTTLIVPPNTIRRQFRAKE